MYELNLDNTSNKSCTDAPLQALSMCQNAKLKHSPSFKTLAKHTLAQALLTPATVTS